MLIVKTVLKLRMERINYISSIYDTIYSLFTGIVVIIFILSDNVFTQSFYDAIDLNEFKNNNHYNLSICWCNDTS